MHKDSKYVLFLDDDVRLHPGSIGALTTEMEKNPDVWSSYADNIYFIISSSFFWFMWLVNGGLLYGVNSVEMMCRYSFKLDTLLIYLQEV